MLSSIPGIAQSSRSDEPFFLFNLPANAVRNRYEAVTLADESQLWVPVKK
jgi:hypothetical protein